MKPELDDAWSGGRAEGKAEGMTKESIHIKVNTLFCYDKSLPTGTPGDTFSFTELKTEVIDVCYYPVIAASTADDYNEETITDVNGHTVKFEFNSKPAYTGKKLTAGSLIKNFRIDGKSVDISNIKVKAKGKKDVGSSVEVTLVKVKGLDKDTNKALKGKSAGTATIRAIVAKEVGVASKWYSSEGTILVKLKNGTAKKVQVLTPSGKYKINGNDISQTSKTVTLKKATYTYDSDAKTLTFNDGAPVTGKVKVSVTS